MEKNKKRMQWSLVVTVCTFLIWVLWDAFGDPTVWNASVFQPFPGLVLCISLILDLWFWYAMRQEKKHNIQNIRSKSGKNIIDIVIIFCMICLMATTCSFLLEYILVHIC